MGWKSRFYPKPTGDPGRDRNARTVQFACVLLAFVAGQTAGLNVIGGDLSGETAVLIFSVAALALAMVMNRRGHWEWAARTAYLSILLAASLRVFDARDGFRSLAMMVFPGMLLISVLLLNKASYRVTAGMVLLAVAALGIAEKQGLTRAIPHFRSPTTYGSIVFVELNLLVFALIGIRIAGDAQSNVFDLRATVGRVSDANLTLEETAKALRESERQLVSIYNTVQDIVFYLAVEPEGQFRFVSVNSAFLRVTGLSLEAVAGKPVNEVVPEPSLTMVLGKYRKAVEEKTLVQWEEASEYPAGMLIGAVSVAPLFDNNGICTHLVGSVHDITERKRAETGLRESEKRLKHAERIAHVGHWDWDIKTNKLFCSDETLRIAGRPLDYIPGYEEFFEIVSDIVSPQDRNRGEQWIRDCLAEKSGNLIEVQIVRPNGDVRTLTLTSEVAVDENGLPARMVGTCQDVTDSRRAQKGAFARLKLETIGTLASGIAHDFNNLLGGVLAQADLALMELATGAHPEEELKRIRNVAIQGAGIVRQLMIYAGKESEDPELIDVSQIVREMGDLLKVSVSKHVTLETDLGRELPAVRANPAQLRQILINLITNASEAMGDRDGVIRLTTRRVTVSGAAAISKNVTEGDYVQLEVSDTGCGMPPEFCDRVFDPFFTTRSAGRGLGLAVVQGIVRKLLGAVEVTSEPGKGTTFQVSLPSQVGVGATATTIRSDDEAPALSRKATILIVEDEDILRQAVAKMLQRTGFEVLEAANGSAAIDLLRAHSGRIHAILLDMTIPGCSSQQVVAEALQVVPDSKVIVTSAYSEEMVMTTISSPLIRGFIRKPFRLGKLVQAFQDVLSS